MLVEQMGGRLWLESEVGRGSVFHFTVWLEHIETHGHEAAQPVVTPPADSSPLRILLAEDNPINQRVVVRMLEHAGHTVVIAANGSEAVSAHAAQPFDLVLMDVHMPEMDGLEAALAIRAQEGPGIHLPIVALTANATAEAGCLAAGMDGYLTKPVRREALFAALARFTSPAVVSPSAAPGAPFDAARASATDL
jgi:CheY-like chemotaxis protein